VFERGNRMLNSMFDDLLFVMIIAGIGLSLAYLRAEYASRRGHKVKDPEKATLQHELHTNGLRLEQKHVIRNPSAFPQQRIREPPGFSDWPIVYSTEPGPGGCFRNAGMLV
jgi:hypothetical protein